MGGRRPLAGAGAADLGDDDGFSKFRRALRGAKKVIDVADALDEQQDHIGRGILHHVIEEFAGAEIGFVAGADTIADRNTQRLGAMFYGKADAAALRDDGGPAPGRDEIHRARLDIDRRAESRRDVLGFAVKPFRIGTGNAHAGPFGERHDGILHRGAVAALLGKSRRDDHRVFDAGAGALLERAEHRACGNDYNGEIDRLADI